jgi:thioester reductase-like protein
MAVTDRVHFVTGYPGFIGKRLVSRLIEDLRGRPERLVLLVQPKSAAAARADLAAQGAERADVVEGDVEQMHLGLSGAEFKALARDVTDVWHLAARAYLGAERAEFRRVNVEGTRNVLDLALAARRLRRLNHFSTAYVSGERVGVILEDELAMGQRFHNPYEETKFQAELLVRRAQAEIPATVYRPSIVVGDSRTGEIDRFVGPYALAILLVASPVFVPLPLPGDAVAPLNVVPVDFVVDAALSISANPAGAGRTVHLVDPSPLSARRVYEMIAERTGKKLPPVSVPARVVQALLQLPLLERLSRVHRPAIEYVNHLAIYNCRNLLELLDGTGIHCPPISSYLDRLIEFVQATYARRREQELEAEADDPLDPRSASPAAPARDRRGRG